MTLKLDLNKSVAAFRLSLEKAGVPADVIAEMVMTMDLSSSFEHEHEEGTTSVLMERFVPLAKIMDPNGQYDLITFSGGPETVTHMGTIDETNANDYIVREIVNRAPGWNGGTTYSYALEEALRIFGWLPCDRDHAPRKSRFWDRWFGTPDQPQAAQPHYHERKRSIVFHVTDGENDPGNDWGDKRRVRQVLRDSQDRGDDVYFMFIGACEHKTFEDVEDIAREFRNTGIVMATDPEEFVELPDDELIARLLVPELVEWLKN